MKILLTIFVSISFLAQSQGSNPLYDGLKNEIKLINLSMNEIDFPKKNKTHYMKYQYSAYFKNNQISPDVHLSVELKRSQEQLHMTSNSYNLYMDKNNAVLVSHDSKMIMMGPATTEEVKNQSMAQIGSFRDSLLSHCKVGHMDVVQVDGRSYKKVLLNTDFRTKETLRIESIEFVYNSEDAYFKKVIIHYSHLHELKRSTYEYETLKLNSDEKLKSPVVQKVMTPSGKIHASLKGYKIIDNRYKESK